VDAIVSLYDGTQQQVNLNLMFSHVISSPGKCRATRLSGRKQINIGRDDDIRAVNAE
jgi:hypothetical protein